jgi:malonate-semialdehyde dehydrogenase (acetylating)/methylmalonate-semialdehyde dehydrogenase
VVLAVKDSHDWVRKGLTERIAGVKIGDGSRDDVTMGPVISQRHKDMVLSYIEKGVAEGAELVVDGRKADMPKEGFFVGPCLFDNVKPEMVVSREEIFGPVLALMSVESLDEAMEIINKHPLANAGSIFTTSGKHAREYKYRSPASMTGINIGVAAPMSFFGFGGAKGSFFGDLKAHGREAFEFYTDRKVVISRWT